MAEEGTTLGVAAAISAEGDAEGQLAGTAPGMNEMIDSDIKSACISKEEHTN